VQIKTFLKLKEKLTFYFNTPEAACKPKGWGKKKSPMQNGGNPKKPKTPHHHTVRPKPKSKKEMDEYIKKRTGR